MNNKKIITIPLCARASKPGRFLFFLPLLSTAFFFLSAPPVSAKDFRVKNDTQEFFFVSGTTGNVGIGSTAPQQKLDVEGTVYVGSGGNVGIGSAVPGAKLVVDGGVYIWNTNGTVNYAKYPGDLYIQNTLEVDGNVYLGDNAIADNLTIMGTLQLSGDTNYTGPVSISTTDANAFSV
ncbi:MAG: hypothetical protein V1913_18750, partial [Fibrobacterota bacterium]